MADRAVSTTDGTVTAADRAMSATEAAMSAAAMKAAGQLYCVLDSRNTIVELSAAANKGSAEVHKI
jgi:hypothetical protein